MMATNKQNSIRRSRGRANRLFIAFSMLAALAGAAVAQSTDRDHPTPMTAGEVRGHGIGEDVDYYYSFVASPGEVTATVDATAAKTFAAVANVSVEIFDRNAKELSRASVITPQTERKVARVQVGRRQPLVMRIRMGKETGSFRVQLGGAVEIAPPESASGNNAFGNRMSLPANGTMVIEMNNGSTREIDLSLVKGVSIKH